MLPHNEQYGCSVVLCLLAELSKGIVLLRGAWLIISVVNYVNAFLSWYYTSIPYYIQERPVRSFIIINIIVVVVIIIYYCYRIIVISRPYYLCVVWLVGITQPKKKVGTVGCTLWLTLQYQNKWYPVVVIDYDSSIIYCLIFFVTTTTILTTPPPTPSSPYWNPRIYW